MTGLNAPQAPLHFVAVLQAAGLDGFRQTRERLFHAVGKPLPDGFLFFLAAYRAAQNVGFLALGDHHFFHFHFGPHLSPVVFQQLCFKPLHLVAWRAYQVLATAFADRLKIFLAHNAAIHHPDAPRLAVFTLDHAQDRLHRRDVRAVAVERLIAERETLAVDDQRDHQLFAVGTMIARVTATDHRILFRYAFHIRTRQIVEQHVELGTEKF